MSEHAPSSPPEAPEPSKKTLAVVAGSAAIVFLALLLLGLVPRAQRDAALKADADKKRQSAIKVSVGKARWSGGDEEVSLPGTIEAIEETVIYARVNGYLKRWLVDIGDAVPSGALLAEIETPELDAEKLQAVATIAQARARLLTAEANVRLAESSYERYKGAAEKGGISPQELAERGAAVETARAAVEAAKADIEAGQANAKRLDELLSFARVRAPFSGIITRRTTEVGSLITAGTGTSQALFRIARVDPVRVFISVPQVYATAALVDQVAELVVREYPGRSFRGKVTRTAGALDPASRTLLTQVEVGNDKRELLPGMYAQVKLTLPHAGEGLRIPASALVVNAQGTQVATVGEGDRVHFLKIDVSGDYGTELAIRGLTGDERIVLDPSGRLSEGTVVQTEAKIVASGGSSGSGGAKADP
jgi:RND family efflux transporter MFP subunit